MKDLDITNTKQQEAEISHPYRELIERISRRYVEGQVQAVRSVNEAIVEANWQIGQYIVEYEQNGKKKAKYGKALLDNLSKDLSLLHGKGFNRSNLQRMRQFYLAYPICAKASHKLSWSHWVELLKVSDELERGFYQQQTVLENWSVPELKRQKDSGLFMRLALSKGQKEILKLARQGQIIESPADAVKEKAAPHNRSEEEIAGYREVLATIHESYEYITAHPNNILQLHRDLYAFSHFSAGGKYKHESENNYLPFLHYYLGVTIKAYREFQDRVEHLQYGKLSKSERIKAIFDRRTGKITKSEILSLCPDISQTTVERTLNELLKSNYIEKTGQSKATGYIKLRRENKWGERRNKSISDICKHPFPAHTLLFLPFTRGNRPTTGLPRDTMNYGEPDKWKD